MTRESRLPPGWRRTLAPPRVRMSVHRFGLRYRCSLRSTLPESVAAPATRVAETPCRARRAADRVRPPVLPPPPRPWRQPGRRRHRRRRSWRAESDPQVADERVWIVAHENRAHAFRALRHQHRSQRARRDREAHRRMRAAGPVVGRRHPKQPVRRFVKASAGIEPGIVDGFSHCLAPLVELKADALRAVGHGIRSRCDAGHGLEDAVKVIRAEPRPLRKRRETRHDRRGFDHAADFRNHRRVARAPARADRACSAGTAGNPPAPLRRSSRGSGRSSDSGGARRTTAGNKRLSTSRNTRTCRRRLDRARRRPSTGDRSCVQICHARRRATLRLLLLKPTQPERRGA